MKLIRIFILTILTFAFLTTKADTLSDVDSLLKVYDKGNGEVRKSAARQLLSIYDDSSVFFSDPPTLSDGANTDTENLTVWFGTARFYTSNSYFSEALQYIDLALPLAEKLEADEIHATLLCDKTYCLYKTSNFSQATETALQATNLCRSKGNTFQLTRAYLYISLVNYALRNYDEATVFVEKAIATDALIPNSSQTDNVLGIACEIYCGAKQIDRAIECGLQAVEAARKAGSNAAIANHLTQLSYAYDRNGDYSKGLQMAEEAIDIVRSNNPLDRNQLAISLEFKGWNLLDLGRHGEAAEAIREAITLEDSIGNYSAVCYDYRTLCECLEPIDPTAALAAMKTYTQMSDSLHAVQIKELTSKANAEVHVDDLEEENAAAHRQSRTILWAALTLGLVLILTIGSLLFAFRQKRRTANALMRINAARESFFTNVTHEFRTPLTVILGLGREIQEYPIKNGDDGQRDSLHEIGTTINRQGMQLLNLVNQLLDISKVKSILGEQPLMRSNISQWVSMVAERHQELARQKGIDLSYSSEIKDLEAAFVPDYITKLTGNLLSNAIKFTPEGGKVRIDLGYGDKGRTNRGDYKNARAIKIMVSDTGLGISPDKIPHIFEPFFHAGKEEGTGVGLALVKQIVESLEGNISVDSKEGTGTTFTVTLPLVSAETLTAERWNAIPLIGAEHTKLIYEPDITNASSAADVHVENEEVDSAPNENEKPAILIIEDNPDVATLIGRQLSGRYDLHYATDGEKGIESARKMVPDLILTDLMMPGTDGLELCRTIRSDNATNHIPIIVITAKATDADRIRGFEAGADAYLYKPFNAEELNIRIEKLLEQRELLQKKYQTTSSWDVEDEANESMKVNSQSSDQPSSDYKSTSDKFVKQVRKTILSLVEEGKSDVEHLAEELCLSQSQLRRKMKAITGQNPKKFIISIRLEKAHEMLESHPELTISHVAESCGFYDQSHFIKYYREAYGVVPHSLGHDS